MMPLSAKPLEKCFSCRRCFCSVAAPGNLQPDSLQTQEVEPQHPVQLLTCLEGAERMQQAAAGPMQGTLHSLAGITK